MDKKKVNSILLIIVFIAIAVLVGAIVVLKAKEKNSSSDAGVAISVETNSNENESTEATTTPENSTDVNEITEEIPAEGTDAQATPTEAAPTPAELTINGHKFTVNSPVTATTSKDSGKEVIQAVSDADKYKMVFGTDSSTSFGNLQANSSLKDLLAAKYNITVSSKIKVGEAEGIKMYLCAITENSKPVYFIVTSLNDNEVVYAKVYNTQDENTLLADLTNAVKELKQIISTLQ